MQTSSLDITLVSPLTVADYASCWVRLEQIIPDASEKIANVADVYNLWMTAASGKSAVRLRPNNCPVEFDGTGQDLAVGDHTTTIRAFLGFYVWPSNPDLDYMLTSTFGEFTDPASISVQRSFSVMIDNQSRFALPYFMTGIDFVWESPVFTANGEQISPPPKITVEAGIWLVFSEPCFGALRVSGFAIGKSIVLVLEFIKAVTDEPMTEEQAKIWHRGPNGEIILTPPPDTYQNGYKISEFKNTVSVSYSCLSMSGEDGIAEEDTENTAETGSKVTTDQYDTELPQCVEEILSWCPGQFDLVTLFCMDPKTTNVYYNTCTGEIMGEEDKSNGHQFCDKVVESPGIGSKWLPEGWGK